MLKFREVKGKKGKRVMDGWTGGKKEEGRKGGREEGREGRIPGIYSSSSNLFCITRTLTKFGTTELKINIRLSIKADPIILTL